MNIEICYKQGEYHWELYDGPDGIDHFNGTAFSLGDAFEQIIKHQIMNSIQYK